LIAGYDYPAVWLNLPQIFKMKFFRIAAFIMILGVGFMACQSTKNSTNSKMLSFNFQPGKSYDYDMITDFEQEVMGQKQQVSVTAQYGMQVKDQSDSAVSIKTVFNAFKMNLDMMGMSLEVDTEKPLPQDTSAEMNPLSMLNKMFHAIKGQEFEMVVTKEGKVLAVNGLEKIAENILSSVDMGEEFKQGMDASFKQQFNDAQMKEQFERAFFIFPNKEVKVGDSWTKEHAAPGGSSAMGGFKTTYTVSEIEGDMVDLDVKSDFSGMESQGSVKGSQSGTMTVDSRSGLIMSSDLDIEMEASEGGQSMKMKGKIKIRGRERN
jgi:hypothetical protein